MKTLFAFVCVAWLLTPTFAVAEETIPKSQIDRPNVLFIAIDDLNDWIGCLDGHPQAHTPNIDRLAKRGVLFTNAHCASPACNPSRAAIFSGLMPAKTGVWSNDSKRLFTQHPDTVVIPRAFKKAGYTTLGTGKMTHSGASANKKMFEHHFGTEQRWSPLSKKLVRYRVDELPSKGTENPRHTVRRNDREPIVLPLNRMPSDRKPNEDDGESFDWGPFDVLDSEMGDTQITDWAIEKLDSDFDAPFFMGVGYYRPHIPLWAPARYFERFDGQEVTLPPSRDDGLNDLSDTAKRWAVEAITAGLHSTVVEHDQWGEAVKAYLACTTYVDAQVGRLLSQLDEGEHADNTIIVLWSDHGWHLGEKQHWGKWTGWERSTRVPLIIVPPKNAASDFAKAGSKCNQPVSLIDLYPTLLELTNVAPQRKLDGKSLVPQLRKPDEKSNRIVATVFDKGNISLRSERYRYIQYTDGSEELYDLENDPNEWTNVIEKQDAAPELKRFRKRFQQVNTASTSDSNTENKFATIDIERTDEGLLLAKVSTESVASNFLIDSGASSSIVIGKHAAESLDKELADSGSAKGIEGEVKVYKASFDRIRIGDQHRLGRREVDVIDLSNARQLRFGKARRKIAGLVGSKLLKELRATIDFETPQMLIPANDASYQSSRAAFKDTKIKLLEGKSALPCVVITINEQEFAFVVDSGSSFNMLEPKIARLLKVDVRPSKSKVSGGGDQAANILGATNILRPKIGHATVPEIQFDIMETPCAAFVPKEYNYGGIIGSKFLTSFDAKIDFDTYTMFIPESRSTAK